MKVKGFDLTCVAVKLDVCFKSIPGLTTFAFFRGLVFVVKSVLFLFDVGVDPADDDDLFDLRCCLVPFPMISLVMSTCTVCKYCNVKNLFIFIIIIIFWCAPDF